jgi:hypothetical protein
LELLKVVRGGNNQQKTITPADGETMNKSK